MRKILRLTKREYLAAVKTKGFIIMLVLMPVLMGGSGIAMYLLRKEAQLAYADIGNELGGRDHTTVMHGVDKITKLIHKDPGANEQIKILVNYISG